MLSAIGRARNEGAHWTFTVEITPNSQMAADGQQFSRGEGRL